MSQLITIVEFRDRFTALKAKGFVASHRRGPTGIGYTLERLLDLVENNIALPDFHDAELKAHRVNSASMITLFTFNRKAWKMPPLEAIRKYGTFDPSGRQGLYFTMSKRPTSTGLFLHTTDETVAVRHIDGSEIAEWRFTDLAEQFRKKFPAMVLVSAMTEERLGMEYFHFTRARLLTGTSPETLHTQIDSGNILIDLRLHDKGTSARNHGTGFRAHEDKLSFLFNRVEDIL